MKLELKHLAPYLPYKLKGKLENDEYYDTKIGVLLRLETAFDSDNIPMCTVEEYEDEIEFFKPILRPLSDLTKEIEVNGEKFVPWNLLEIDSSIVDFLSVNNQPIIRLIDCEFIYAIDVYNNIIQKLIEWHFDVFGLIEKGLAIDINSLPQSSE